MLKFLKNKLLIIISLCSTFLFCIIFFQNFSISDSLPPPIPYIPLPALASFYNQNLIINSCDVSIVPGNVSDDTKMLQSFLDTTAPGKTLCLLSGTFNIKTATDSGDPLGIKIPSHIRLKLASDTILKAIPNNFSSYAVLQIIDQVDVLVDGGIIDGDISNFTNSRNGEWGMGINILGSSQITIRNITIKHCWGDGIYLSVGSSGQAPHLVDIVDIKSKFHRRQGISLIAGKQVAIIRAELTDIGGPNIDNSGIMGIAPSAGIDIEPNAQTSPAAPDESVEDIQLLDVTTARNLTNANTSDTKDSCSQPHVCGFGILIAMTKQNSNLFRNVNVYHHFDESSNVGLQVYSDDTSTGKVSIQASYWLQNILRSTGFSLGSSNNFNVDCTFNSQKIVPNGNLTALNNVLVLPIPIGFGPNTPKVNGAIFDSGQTLSLKSPILKTGLNYSWSKDNQALSSSSTLSIASLKKEGVGSYLLNVSGGNLNLAISINVSVRPPSGAIVNIVKRYLLDD